MPKVVRSGSTDRRRLGKGLYRVGAEGKQSKKKKLLGWSLSGCLVWESLAVIGCSQISLSQIQVNSGLVSGLWLSFCLAYGGYQGIGVTSV